MSLEHTVTMTITVRPLTVSPRELLSPDSRVSISTSLTRKGSGDERGWDTRRESHTQAQGANQRENHTARPCILGSLPVITRALGERRATGSRGGHFALSSKQTTKKRSLCSGLGSPSGTWPWAHLQLWIAASPSAHVFVVGRFYICSCH